jgi:hypothetical protein
MPFLHSSLRLRRTLSGALLLALALAQTLGLMHRIVHAPLPAHVATLVDEQRLREAMPSTELPANGATAIAEPTGEDAAHWLQRLFAGHDKDRDCRLYDQLSHADLLWGDVPALEPAEFVECRVVVHAAWQLAWQAAGFLARGPPVLS